VSATSAALAAHHQAVADRLREERSMGGRWRDAAANVVDQRYLAPLAQQDRALADALTDLGRDLDRAQSLIS
jgi:hypothetical protein